MDIKRNIDFETLFCPITLGLMIDPVKASDGHYYEREALINWLLINNTSPLTREPIVASELKIDLSLKKAITEYRVFHPGL